MEGIQLSVEKTGIRNRVSVIKVGGYIDTTTSAELEHALGSLLKAGSYDIVVDLGNVDYVSSAGWGIFISEIKGIREKGGDLKLVRMIPEVYEVFELLEFHFILKAFDTLEEAIRDFERTRPAVMLEDTSPSARVAQTVKAPERTEEDTTTPKEEELKGASLEDKIRKIVAEFPDAGTVQVARTLNTKHYGFEKLGWFKLRRLLKKLNLDSKRKREIYAKQLSRKQR